MNKREKGKYATNYTGETMCKESEHELANVNSIMKKAVNGVLPRINPKSPIFGDFTNVGTYQEVCNRINEIQDEFIRNVPADIRLRHGNDPGKFMDWIHDPENKEEAIKLGLLEDPEGQKKVATASIEAKAQEAIDLEAAIEKKRPKAAKAA